jgi:FkbM family methyltransferase
VGAPACRCRVDARSRDPAGPSGLAARAVYGLLGLAPAAAVGRSRTLGRGAAAVDAAVALASRPLFGSVVPVRAGPAAGVLLRAERRSTAWITGKVEPEVQLVLGGLLRPGATFVDAGAGIGFFSLLAARLVGEGGAVVAFEPSPVHAASVRANVALNGFANVEVVETAVSDRPRVAFLEDPSAATATLGDVASRRSIAVDAVSLDDFLAAREGLVPDLVKVDVEGHEAAVLRGMSETLSRTRPRVVLELHGDTTVLGALAAARYGWRPLGGPRSPAQEGEVAWGHVLATPAERDG